MRIARPKSSARRAAAVGALALLAAMTVGAVGQVPTASAHNYLVSSTPAAGSVLTSLPPEFVITTNDVLLDFGGENTGSAGALEVQGPDGLFYGDGCVAVSGASISTPAAIGPAGDYTVIWRVVSTDGHPVSSQFSFTWQPDAAHIASAGSAAAPVCPTASDAAGAVDGAGAASGDSEADTPASTAASSDDEFLSVLAWGGGALGAVAIAVVATLLVLRRPKLGAGPGSDSRPPGDI
jgi:methionine-rich copper-binding protein CopC